jgi:hypothetical protein
MGVGTIYNFDIIEVTYKQLLVIVQIDFSKELHLQEFLFNDIHKTVFVILFYPIVIIWFHHFRTKSQFHKSIESSTDLKLCCNLRYCSQMLDKC